MIFFNKYILIGIFLILLGIVLSPNPGTVNEYYSIVFKTNKGERKIAVNKSDYSKWKVGDKARKIKGKFGVEKLS